PRSAYAGEVEAVEELFANVVLPPSASSGSSSTGVDVPSTPAASGERDCDALATFRSESVARFDQAQAAHGQVAASMSSVEWNLAAGTVRSLAVTQRSADVPAGAEAAQDSMVSLLEAMATDLEATAGSRQALEAGRYLDAVPPSTTNIYALIDQAFSDLHALPETCSASGSSGSAASAGSGSGSTAGLGLSTYACPPDQATIDGLREQAATYRSLASGLPIGSSKGSLQSQAAYADQLADEMIATCAGS
ncbi:MAG: hypothetical protein H0V37_13195, partial [Chloroflexia bacterium]|nr:hypothetical protein [Chloroflexia bacterium]